MSAHVAPDIRSRADIVRLVDAFYDHVRGDDLLGPIFDGVAKTDWAVHLPKMYDFWDTILFGVATYRGNPMPVHAALAHQVPLGEQAFERWLAMFQQTVDGLFQGPSAEDIKLRAWRIAMVMQHHIASGVQPAPAAT